MKTHKPYVDPIKTVYFKKLLSLNFPTKNRVPATHKNNVTLITYVHKEW